MGLALLLQAPALLAMRIGNLVLQIDSVRDADLYRTNWQALAQGKPDTAYHCGLNLVAAAPTPDSGGGNNYSMMATVVENAPIPTSDTANVQVARDDLDAIIDYAQHLASFKLGGSEFLSTMPLLERFLTRAQVYNSKLKELAPFTTALYGLSQRQERMAPRMSEVSSAS